MATFFDANGSEQAQRVGVQRINRFILNDAIDELEQRIIAGTNRVESLARDVDELHRRRVGRLTERINFQVLLYVIDAGLGIAVLQEGTEEQQVSNGARTRNEISVGN